MPFTPIAQSPKLRRWLLWGYANDGKSTFAVQMPRNLGVIDSDSRFNDVACGDPRVFRVCDNAADAHDVLQIRSALRANMPSSGIQSLVVDSATAIISPLTQDATLLADSGAFKNKSAAFKEKAVLIRTLLDEVNRWGTHVLWIAHYEDTVFSGARKPRRTIPEIEVDRMWRGLTMELSIVRKKGCEERGIRVDRARSGRSGLVLWDDTGAWVGMPDRIETAVESPLLPAFTNLKAMVSGGVERGVFATEKESLEAYESMKSTLKPIDGLHASHLWDLELQAKAA